MTKVDQALNEYIFDSHREIREKLASELCRELGENLPIVLMMKMEKAPLFEVLLFDKFRNYSRRN